MRLLLLFTGLSQSFVNLKMSFEIFKKLCQIYCDNAYKYRGFGLAYQSDISRIIICYDD